MSGIWLGSDEKFRYSETVTRNWGDFSRLPVIKSYEPSVFAVIVDSPTKFRTWKCR
jgi:hypothetical protein